MQHLLQASIDAFGPAPRKFSLWDRWVNLQFLKPKWLKQDPNNALNTQFHNLQNVLSNGVVVWGHIIQANSLMFEPGPQDCPASVVYSLHDADRVDESYLRDVAHEIFDLKGTTPTDPELLPIAEYLTSEVTSVFGLPVPEPISPGYRCMISSTMLFRNHLPKRFLCRSFFPLIVNPSEPHVVLPLPARYWSKELKEWWVRWANKASIV